MQVTAQQAQAIIKGAAAKAKALRVPVTITILDAGCHLKAFERMDGAPLGSIDISMGKAKTAVLFSCNSEDLWDYCKPGARAPGLELSNGGLITFAGGIALKRPDGTLIGAIGVSGGVVSQDKEIAQAGVAASDAWMPEDHQANPNSFKSFFTYFGSTPKGDSNV